MKKVLSIALIAFILATLFIPVVSAYENPPLYDQAGLLSESENTEVQKALKEVGDKYNMDVVVLTVDNYKTAFDKSFYDISDAAEYYCSSFLDKDCVLFMQSIDDRDYWMETGGYGTTAFTTYGREYICEIIRAYLSNSDYKQAYLKYAELADEFLAEAKKGTPYDKNNPREIPVDDETKAVKSTKSAFDYFKSIGISLGVGLIIALIVCLSIRSKYKPVRLKAEANDYLVQGSLNLRQSYDRFLYTHVTRTRKAKDNSSGGSISSTSTGSGGKY